MGSRAPASYSEFSGLTSIKEDQPNLSADQMTRSLIKGHEDVVRTCEEALKAAENTGDAVSQDLLTARMKIHEKTVWMLRACSVEGR